MTMIMINNEFLVLPSLKALQCLSLYERMILPYFTFLTFQVKKETQQLREFEEGLVSQYKFYLENLEQTVRGKTHSSKHCGCMT